MNTYRWSPSRRVLVADDDPQGIAVLLKHLGHDVHVARDGPAAVEAARSKEPQVVILGLGLPGLDGYEVLERLRGFSRAPVVALSRCAREEERERLRAAGFDEHLAKPAHLKALRRLIDQL
jgi:two-component system CheB/CheR fusion protein